MSKEVGEILHNRWKETMDNVAETCIKVVYIIIIIYKYIFSYIFQRIYLYICILICVCEIYLPIHYWHISQPIALMT